MVRRQETVAEWVTNRPIFDVCARNTGFEGGGRLWVPWWRQNAAKEQLRVTLEAILAVEKVRRQQESGRRERSEEGSEGGSTESEE